MDLCNAIGELWGKLRRTLDDEMCEEAAAQLEKLEYEAAADGRLFEPVRGHFFLVDFSARRAKSI